MVVQVEGDALVVRAVVGAVGALQAAAGLDEGIDGGLGQHVLAGQQHGRVGGGGHLRHRGMGRRVHRGGGGGGGGSGSGKTDGETLREIAGKCGKSRCRSPPSRSFQQHLCKGDTQGRGSRQGGRAKGNRANIAGKLGKLLEKFYCLRQCTSKRGCQSVRQASSQSDRNTHFGFFVSGRHGCKQWGEQLVS